MKFNKKIIVPALSTVMGLSLVGGIAGTFAWYQYSTQATTSLLATNVAETGVLEISATSASAGFKRDLITADLLGARENSNVTPVTFGQIVNGDPLPADAYKNPNASLNGKAGVTPGSYEDVYEAADAAHDYIQYNIWVRAREVGNVADGLKQVAKDVFLTDIVLEDYNEGEHYIDSALRVHLAVDEDNNGTAEKNFLFAKDAVDGLQLYGVLDCDNDDHPDIKGGYEWKDGRNDLVYYGNAGEYQKAIAKDSLLATKVSGNIDPHSNDNIDKKLFTTPTSGAAKVTVTIWLEGWDNSVASHKKNVSLQTVKNIYIQDETMKAESLTGKGLFTKAGNEYAVASGDAVTGTSYYAVSYEKVHLVKGSAITALTYRATADATAAFVAEGTVGAEEGEDYYIVHDKDVSSSIRYAVADTSASYFVKDSENYVPAPASEAVSGTTYYRLLAEAAGAEAVNASTATGTESVEGLYTRSGDAGNYVFTAAHGKNVMGTTYYSLSNVNIENVPMWTGLNTIGAQFKFGLTFDVGQDAFKA